jgi:hypothetical protein
MNQISADLCWVSVWQIDSTKQCSADSSSFYNSEAAPAALFTITPDTDYSQQNQLFLSQTRGTRLCAYLDYVNSSTNSYTTAATDEAVVAVKTAVVKKKKVLRKKVVHHKAKAKAKARFTG